MQIHDELLFECKNEHLSDEVDMIRSVMEDIVDLRVPLSVQIKTGPNWDQLVLYRL